MSLRLARIANSSPDRSLWIAILISRTLRASLGMSRAVAPISSIIICVVFLYYKYGGLVKKPSALPALQTGQLYKVSGTTSPVPVPVPVSVSIHTEQE